MAGTGQHVLYSLLSPSFLESAVKQYPDAFAAVVAGDKSRGGKWSAPEQLFADALLTQFENCTLPVAPATSLRGLLAEATNSNPLRVTKKYSSRGQSLGKQKYSPHQGPSPSADELQHALEQRETTFLRFVAALDAERLVPGMGVASAASARRKRKSGEAPKRKSARTPAAPSRQSTSDPSEAASTSRRSARRSSGPGRPSSPHDGQPGPFSPAGVPQPPYTGGHYMTPTTGVSSATYTSMHMAGMLALPITVTHTAGRTTYSVTASPSGMEAHRRAMAEAAAHLLPLMAPPFAARTAALASTRALHRNSLPAPLPMAPGTAPSAHGSYEHTPSAGGVHSARTTPSGAFLVAGVSPNPTPGSYASSRSGVHSVRSGSTPGTSPDQLGAVGVTGGPGVTLQYTMLSPPGASTQGPLPAACVLSPSGLASPTTTLVNAAARHGHGPASPSVAAAGSMMALASCFDPAAPPATPASHLNPAPKRARTGEAGDVTAGTPGHSPGVMPQGSPAAAHGVNPTAVLTAVAPATSYTASLMRARKSNSGPGWGVHTRAPGLVPLVVHPRNTALGTAHKSSRVGNGSWGDFMAASMAASEPSLRLSVPAGVAPAALARVPVGAAAAEALSPLLPDPSSLAHTAAMSMAPPSRSSGTRGISVIVPTSRVVATLEPSPTATLPDEVLGTGTAPDSALTAPARATRQRQLSRAESEMSTTTVDYEAAGVLTEWYQVG